MIYSAHEALTNLLMFRSLPADLKQLAESAANASVDLPQTNAMATTALLGTDSPSLNSFESSGDHRTPYRRWLAVASLPFLAFAGYLIVLQTQQGNLVIESEVADVTVKLLRGGEPIKELSINTGSSSTRLRADQYEIVIQSPSDGVTVENNQFTLQRGETVVARIRRSSDITSPAVESLSDAKLNRNIVEPGDTLAIYLEGILPFTPPDQPLTSPPILQMDNHPPATGYPIRVDFDGDITLPLIGQLHVSGKTVSEVRELIREEYLKRKILKEDGTRLLAPIVSMFLKYGEAAKFNRHSESIHRSTPSRKSPTQSELDRIEPGDTLAIYIEGFVPPSQPDQPPLPPNVIQYGERPPVIGYPFLVLRDGMIVLPLVGQIDVGNRSITQAREQIRNAYLERKIFLDDERNTFAPSVSILSKSYE